MHRTHTHTHTHTVSLHYTKIDGIKEKRRQKRKQEKKEQAKVAVQTYKKRKRKSHCCKLQTRAVQTGDNEGEKRKKYTDKK